MRVFLTLVLALSPLAAHAQEEPKPKPTSVRGVPMGMSFAEFEAKANLKKNCKGILNPCKKQIKDAEAGGRGRFDEYPYAFLFEGGRLVMIEVHAQDFAVIVSEATSKYGKPSTIEEDTVQNGYGAQFKVGRARWDMPDGTVITAFETITPSSMGYLRGTDLRFCSAEKQHEFDNLLAQKPVL